jgi:N-acetylmuramic acid 6-phosphate (MurNAc-6-P) etherase
MIDVVPANAKLKDRLVGIVADIASAPEAAARTALIECDWDARAAVVRISRGVSADEARRRAAGARTLRDALR